MIESQGKTQSRESESKMTQMELVIKEFKVVVRTNLSDIKEIHIQI